MTWRRAGTVAALVVVIVLAVLGATGTRHRMLIGVYQPNSPGSYGEITTFSQQAGLTPRITSYYSTFTQPFALSFAQQAAKNRTMVLVQWQPRGTTNAQVASGADDAYIRQFAQAVGQVNNQVIISYGQEMNGNWYDWGTNGAGNSNPTDFVNAWKHVWNIFQQEGIYNVTWLWDPNVAYTGSTPFKSIYPGDQYVTWVGLDGYYAHTTDTFASLFTPSINQLRAITAKPLLIAESGVTGATGPTQLAGLFSGASLAGAVGIVYFDQAQSGDPEHQDWRLEDNPATMAAFKTAVQLYAERPLIPQA
jgi:hypothetical protein